MTASVEEAFLPTGKREICLYKNIFITYHILPLRFSEVAEFDFSYIGSTGTLRIVPAKSKSSRRSSWNEGPSERIFTLPVHRKYRKKGSQRFIWQA